MGKGANKQLIDTAGVTGKRASADYNFVDPRLQRQADNPQGFTPQQMAYMRTASEQSLGGGDAATTGQANLEATRTRNTGGFQGAVGTANRANQRQASQNAVSIEEEQAKLQEAQKQDALRQLETLYGTNIGASVSALGATKKNGPGATSYIDSLAKAGMTAASIAAMA